MSKEIGISIKLKPGIYVLAVSGGVDSMTLLDLLVKDSKSRFIVAHFDHGIRSDSNTDHKLVQKIALEHGLPFVFDKGNLGSAASEEVARNARYEFLNKIKDTITADAIITAHHQDDLLETIIINLIRGTGRKGLSSLKDSAGLLRPLLDYDKKQLIEYAEKNKLVWREDSTNADTNITRNYIRLKMIPKLSSEEINKLLSIAKKTKTTNKQADILINKILKQYSNKNTIKKDEFINLPHSIAKEIMIAWLNNNGVKNLDRKKIEKLSIAFKTLKPNKKIDIDKNHYAQIEKDHIVLSTNKQK